MAFPRIEQIKPYFIAITSLSPSLAQPWKFGTLPSQNKSFILHSTVVIEFFETVTPFLLVLEWQKYDDLQRRRTIDSISMYNIFLLIIMQ
jgi:hypothetical protein